MKSELMSVIDQIGREKGIEKEKILGSSRIGVVNSGEKTIRTRR